LLARKTRPFLGRLSLFENLPDACDPVGIFWSRGPNTKVDQGQFSRGFSPGSREGAVCLYSRWEVLVPAISIVVAMNPEGKCSEGVVKVNALSLYMVPVVRRV
jgi:hypothetical protein